MLNRYTAYLNGKIITIDPQDTIAEAVLVEGDKIAAVGTNSEIRALLPPGGETVDLGGRCVIPGIIDAHVHVELTVNQAVNGVNVQQPHGPNCDTVEKILNAIAAKAADTPKGEWITAMASNLTADKVAEGRLPTREELDRISTEHPIMFTSEVHLIVMNTMAIELLGYELERKLGPNVTMGRSASGEPTGVYVESWTQHSLTPWGYDKLLSALRTGVTERFVSHGVTSAQELVYSMDGLRAWQQLRRESALPLRLRLYFTHPQLIDLDEFLASGIDRDFGDDWLRVGGIKFFADGIGLHANFVPYSDLKYEQDELNELVYKAHARGLQTWIHTTTEPAMEMGMRAYKYALDRLPSPDARLRLEHSADRISIFGMQEKHIDFLKRYSVMPMATPQFMYTFPDHQTRYRTFIHEHGFKLFYNSDCTGSQPEACNPWHGIWSLVARKNYLGEEHRPEERLTPLEALRMATLWSAYAGFEEKVKGSIEPGKLADLVVLGDDPLTCEPDALREMKVEQVIIGGEAR